MSPSLDFLSAFRSREGEDSVLKAKWYIAAATGLTAAGAGELVLQLYRLASAELPLKDKKIVQRRIKEAILKGSILYGVPRMGQALGPLNDGIPDEEIDNYGPRTEALDEEGENERIARRGHAYFDKLWKPAAAQAMRDRLTKYQKDQQLLVQSIYEQWMSEDHILSDVETQMCNTTLLTCWESPVHALWHTKGVVRLGGTVEQAKFAQDLGIAIAKEFGSKTGDITMVDDIDF